jgi:cytidyltransferase-like protein
MNKKEILSKILKLKKNGKKVVFTNGCFDILHSGHIKVLKECSRLGDIVVVGLNSDGSVKKLKGPKGR